MHAVESLRFVPLGRLGSTRFGVAPSWLATQLLGLAGFSAFAYVTVAGQLGHSLGVAGSASAGLVLLVALDFSVLVHEAGHAVAAMAAGLSVHAVVLMPYGGATLRSTSPNGAIVECWTAAGGPLANLLVALVCGLLLLAIEPRTLPSTVLLIAGALQALSALTNLLPIACLDGARIARFTTMR